MAVREELIVRVEDRVGTEVCRQDVGIGHGDLESRGLQVEVPLDQERDDGVEGHAIRAAVVELARGELQVAIGRDLEGLDRRGPGSRQVRRPEVGDSGNRQTAREDVSPARTRATADDGSARARTHIRVREVGRTQWLSDETRPTCRTWRRPDIELRPLCTGGADQQDQECRRGDSLLELSRADSPLGLHIPFDLLSSNDLSGRSYTEGSCQRLR